MAISYPIFNSGSSLLDIPKARALSAEQKEQQDRPPFLLPTPSSSRSTSLPFGTITGSEMGINRQQQHEQLSLSKNNNNGNNSLTQSNLVRIQASNSGIKTLMATTTENIPNQYIVVLK